MIETQNVQIPLELFKRIVAFFDFISFSNLKIPSSWGFDDIHSCLNEKMNRINQRAAYTRAVYATDDAHKDFALAAYLKLKNSSRQ